jgi:hypothetical protein
VGGKARMKQEAAGEIGRRLLRLYGRGEETDYALLTHSLANQLRKAQGRPPSFQRWHKRHGRDDFRTANIEPTWEEATGILGFGNARLHMAVHVYAANISLCFRVRRHGRPAEARRHS